MRYFENKLENNIYFTWQHSMQLRTQYTKIHSIYLNNSCGTKMRLRSGSL